MVALNDQENPSDTLQLATPESYPAFPYTTPYSIQLDLMRHLYDSIESRSLAMYLSFFSPTRLPTPDSFWFRSNRIESPTGTGKTLTLLTAALTWLRDDRDRSKNGQLAQLTKSLRDKSSSKGTVRFSLLRLSYFV